MKIGIVGKSRYIDVDKFAEARCNFQQIDEDAANAMIWLLRTFPTADVVEVRHAYWKETNHITESKRGREIHSKLYNCSYCDAPNGRKKSSYCHWCGAKMDGERSKNGK